MIATPNPDRPAGKCPICGTSAAVPLLARRGFTIVRCVACEVGYVSPAPSVNQLDAHYQRTDYFKGSGEQGYRDYTDMRKALLPHFGRRLRKIDRLLRMRGRLLDVGCAAGYFLEVARRHRWEIAGVEVAANMAELASQALGVPIAPALDALAEDGFDAVTLWEVIEHLPEPLAELRKLRDLLRPGGLLMLSTPNNGHWQALYEHESWLAYRPPSHLVYFNHRNLADALGRAGFDRIAVTRVAPLPRLPSWLRRISAPLERGLTSGEARAWRTSLLTWRVVRLFGFAWAKVAHPHEDAFATLEAVAFRPL